VKQTAWYKGLVPSKIEIKTYMQDIKQKKDMLENHSEEVDGII
jgi:hypothetical protein